MRDEAQVVVVGGGVVGASVLYHLTKRGWTDLLLLERSELTSGSTWHAAGGMHTLNGDPNVAGLQQYTIELYREIEEISGRDCGIHLTGGVILADDQERLDWLRMAQARGRYLGMQTEMISTKEAKDLFPLLDERHFVGALYDPIEGHVDPSGVTHAYAGAARVNGAEIERHCRVTEIHALPDGRWRLLTTKGEVIADHVVNAGGLWAREVGRMIGLEIPVLAMEHMYLITEEMPEVVAHHEATDGTELPGVLDFGGELYLRQEGMGMLMGTYEQAGKPWARHETPWDFDTQLLPPDLDRIAPSLEVGFAHYPAFADAGIRDVINGPFTFAPDGNPLIGPVRGIRNYWLACGVMAGLSQGGGVGLALANWMTDGDPGLDVWAMDNSRFGDWATTAYTEEKVRENYARRFRITFPNEELPAGRPLQTTPVYDRLDAANAVWGAGFGLEYPLWFQTPGEEPVEEVTFKRSNAFPRVAEECAAVRERAGLLEISNFAKYRVSGPAAASWLDTIMANRLPKPGRLALSPMLNDLGMLIGDFTVGDLGDGEFYVFGSGLAEDYHMRWFLDHLPDDGSVIVEPEGPRLTGFSLAGPRSRDILQALTEADLSPETFRFLDIRRIEVGLVPALVGRISFTGELGYELWVRPEYQRRLFDDLVAAGEPHGLRLFGARALDSLRLDKSYGAWASEYRNVYDPYEAGLGWAVKPDKGYFVGGEAAAAAAAEPPRRRLVAFRVDADDADVTADEPIFHGDDVVGWVTSGGYAHWSEASVALGYVPTELVDAGDFSIEIIGSRRAAELLPEPLHDPEGARMRS
ncbi:MAG: FAD-dependent oxidoreductase [Acidimicrobiia bacterium]|nr:FAD-dependent oxidoreductase [Acidimicrobiia bacterium]